MSRRNAHAVWSTVMIDGCDKVSAADVAIHSSDVHGHVLVNAYG